MSDVDTDKHRERILEAVADILVEERESKGLSMTVVSERSGLSRAMISFIENKRRNPTLDSLLRIADVLEVDIATVIRRAQKRAERL